MTDLDREDITEPMPGHVTGLVCAECGADVERAGGTPSPDAIATAKPDTCAAGASWSWCSTMRRYSVWLDATPLASS